MKKVRRRIVASLSIRQKIVAKEPSKDGPVYFKQPQEITVLYDNLNNNIKIQKKARDGIPKKNAAIKIKKVSTLHTFI